LDAANIDLKCFDDAVYKKLTTGGRLNPVLSTLKTLKNHDIWLEITNLIIPTYNDDPKMIQSMCEWLIENGFAEHRFILAAFSLLINYSMCPPPLQAH